jgi:hypothetical protein
MFSGGHHSDGPLDNKESSHSLPTSRCARNSTLPQSWNAAYDLQTEPVIIGKLLPGKTIAVTLANTNNSSLIGPIEEQLVARHTSQITTLNRAAIIHLHLHRHIPCCPNSSLTFFPSHLNIARISLLPTIAATIQTRPLTQSLRTIPFIRRTLFYAGILAD